MARDAPSKLIGFKDIMVATTIRSPMPRDLGLMPTQEWDASVRCLLECIKKTLFRRTLSRNLNHRPIEVGVVAIYNLIGNATLVISPSGGVGAATALKDAVALTKALQRIFILVPTVVKVLRIIMVIVGTACAGK